MELFQGLQVGSGSGAINLNLNLSASAHPALHWCSARDKTVCCSGCLRPSLAPDPP